MFLKKMNKIFDKFILSIPITVRVTAWYTFFIVILFAIILSSAFYIENKLISDISTKNLVETMDKIYHDPDEFEDFDDGIYFIKYDEQNRIIAGKLPKDFNIGLPFSIEDINEFQVNNKKFLYYDVKMKNSQEWVRGVFPISKFQKEIHTLLYIIFGLSPIILILILYGGHKILKKAFKPIKKISDTALEIKKSKNFSKRIRIGYGKDEIYKIASTFNEMLDSLEGTFIREKQFSSDASHELRTPITVILAESDYALKYADTLEEAKESLKVIDRQSKKMSNLINQIMELSRLEKQKDIEKEKINFSAIVNQILLDYKNLLEQKKIKLISNIQENLEVFGNRTMLERVFINFFNNAMKFTEDTIIVNLQREDDEIILEVKDNGIGLSEEDKQRVWDRFYQVSDSRNKEENKGSGLGLSMVKKIAELHSAEIFVEGELGKGASFKIKFKNKKIKK